MEDLAVLLNSCIRVSIGVDRHEDGHNVEVLVLLGCLDLIDGLGKFLEGHGADIGAEREAKVDEIVLLGESLMRHRFTFGVIELPGPSNIRLSRVGGR